jgi:hypothetical protein
VANSRVARFGQELRFFVSKPPDYSADKLPSVPMAQLH